MLTASQIEQTKCLSMLQYVNVLNLDHFHVSCPYLLFFLLLPSPVFFLCFDVTLNLVFIDKLDGAEHATQW